MTEPDEALIWARERAKADWLECDDEVGGLHAAAEDFPSGDSDHFEDIEWRAEAYRAGQAASAERIKALEHDLMWTDQAWESAQESVVYGYTLMDRQDARIKALEEAGDLLAWLAEHPEIELSWGDVGAVSECLWRVHLRHGGINDREWRLVDVGHTPTEALTNARKLLKEADQ